MARLLGLALLVVSAQAQDGGACRPTGETPSSSETSGTLLDGDIALDWQIYDPWSTGHCMDLRFVNTGPAASNWRFDVVLDAPVADLSYTGPLPGILTASGNTLTIEPTGNTELAAFATIETAACFEPQALPTRLETTVTVPEPGDTVTGPGGGDDEPLFGSLRSPTGEVVVTWDEREGTGDDCLLLSLGNLTEDDIDGWQLRLLLPSAIDLTGSDGRFFVLDDVPGELDIRPTTDTVEIPAFGTVSGEICYKPLAEPYALVMDLDPRAAAPTPPATPDVPAPPLPSRLDGLTP